MTKCRHRPLKQNTESPAFCRRIAGNQSSIIRSKPLKEKRREGKLSVSFYPSLVLLSPTRSLLAVSTYTSCRYNADNGRIKRNFRHPEVCYMIRLYFTVLEPWLDWMSVSHSSAVSLLEQPLVIQP